MMKQYMEEKREREKRVVIVSHRFIGEMTPTNAIVECLYASAETVPFGCSMFKIM